MRALLAFLIGLGVLIIAGFVFVGVEIYYRATDPSKAMSVREVETAITALGLPADTSIDSLTPVGDRLVTQVRLPNGDQHLIIINVRNGEIVSSIAVTGSSLRFPEGSP